ncbi:MAG: MASE1 domain-containing protein [Acidimicrobiales bacterium]
MSATATTAGHRPGEQPIREPAGTGGAGLPTVALDAAAGLVGYLVLARVTIELSSDNLPTPLWAAVGWALGLCLLRDRHRWPAVIGGAAAGELLNNLLIGFASWQMVPALVANTVEMSVAAVLFVRLAGEDRRLDRRRGLVALLVAVAAAGVIGASIGALVGLPDLYWFDWWRWWRGDTLGYLIATPLVLAAGQWWRQRRMPPFGARRTARGREAVALGAAVIVACAVVFSIEEPLVYLLLPLLSLCAYRFGVLGASASTAAVVVATFAATSRGAGPLAVQVLDHKTVAQLFFVGAALSNLLLAAEVGEANRAERARRRAEARYRAIVESAFEGVLVSDRAGRITFANDRAVALSGSRNRGELVGRPVAELFDDPATSAALQPDGATAWTAQTARTARAGQQARRVRRRPGHGCASAEPTAPCAGCAGASPGWTVPPRTAPVTVMVRASSPMAPTPPPTCSSTSPARSSWRSAVRRWPPSWRWPPRPSANGWPRTSTTGRSSAWRRWRCG